MLTQSLLIKNSNSSNSLTKSPVKAGLFILNTFSIHILFLLIAIFFLQSCDLFSLKVKKTVAVQVEDKTLTIEQFSKDLAKKLSQLDPLSAKDTQIVRSFKSKITSDFIVDSLIEVWFEKQNLKIDEKELDAEIKKTIALYPSDQSFREELASQEISYQSWKKSLELSLKRKALFKSLQGQISAPTEEELQTFYNNNKQKYYQNEMVLVDSILIEDENQADVIKTLYTKKKHTFESLFNEYSLDKKTQKTPNMGWIERVPESDYDILFSSKKSDLLGPIKFDDGFRIFKVKGRKPSQQKKFEDVKQNIKSEILSLRESARFSSWLDEQIKVNKILKNNAAIDSLSVETRNE